MASFSDALRGYAFSTHQRDEWKCVYCGLDGTKSFTAWLSLTLDHLLPKHDPRREDEEFLVTACGFCNGSDNLYFAQARARGITFRSKSREKLIAQRKPYVQRTRAAYHRFWARQVHGESVRMLTFDDAGTKWWNKSLVKFRDTSTVAELAILSLACRRGEVGAWLNSPALRTGAVELLAQSTPHGKGWATWRVELPAGVVSRLRAVYKIAKIDRGRADLVIWRAADGRLKRLIEVKRRHRDRQSPEQRKFLAAARQLGIEARVVEWDLTSGGP